ncbi:MAG: ATP-binding protein [Phycisphaerales bacterium]|nr:ATP-binding protein [Phycisphaerales bacterium]
MSPSPDAADEGSSHLREESGEIERVQAGIAQALLERHYSQASIFAIRLSIEEAIMNGFQHGNRADPNKRVEVRWFIDRTIARFHVIDEGEGFDPTVVPDPTLDENLEIPSGRGLMLIRAYMSEARYHGLGNHLEMSFRKPVSP